MLLCAAGWEILDGGQAWWLCCGRCAFASPTESMSIDIRSRAPGDRRRFWRWTICPWPYSCNHGVPAPQPQCGCKHWLHWADCRHRCEGCVWQGQQRYPELWITEVIGLHGGLDPWNAPACQHKPALDLSGKHVRWCWNERYGLRSYASNSGWVRMVCQIHLFLYQAD